MTSAPPVLGSTRPADAQQPRLTLKPRTPITGRVDGGWWPRSRDLAAEIPALQAALAQRLGAVERVSYRIEDWDTTARRTSVDGRTVRLSGYRGQPAATVDVIGARRRVTLLVVAPDAAPATADAALAAAGRAGNTDEIDVLLHSSPGDGTRRPLTHPEKRSQP